MLGLASWALFALAWWRVIDLGAAVSSVTIAGVALTAVLVLVIDMWWIRHNRGIYRRKGPRRGRPQVDLAFERDSLGRTLEIPFEALTTAEVSLTVTVDGKKVYRPEGIGA